MDAQPILEAIAHAHLQVRAILITHAHSDHIYALDELRDAWNVPVFAIGSERLTEFQQLNYGQELKFGNMNICILQTIGHAVDGASFLVSGLSKPLALSGDALFAGSMGGGMVSFRQAIETTRASLLALAPETVVCPGHGPLTTIGLEQMHNAFFGE